MSAAPPLPLVLLTGFLGAGKTTLLNRLIRSGGLPDTAIMINELGAVALDHLLLPTAEGVLELGGGCICCDLRGDLEEALLRLLMRRDRGRGSYFARIVLETSGAATPGPIVRTLATHPVLATRLLLDRIVTVVDGLHAGAMLDYVEARDQIGAADLILVSKLGKGEALPAPLRERIGSINPTAAVVRLDEGGDRISLFGRPPERVERRLESIADWRGGGLQDHSHFQPVSLTRGAPVPHANITAFLDAIVARWGARIIRAKGLINTVERPDAPLIAHIVSGSPSPLDWLEAWPAGMRGSSLVVITDGVPASEIEACWRAFCTPDA